VVGTGTGVVVAVVAVVVRVDVVVGTTVVVVGTGVVVVADNGGGAGAGAGVGATVVGLCPPAGVVVAVVGTGWQLPGRGQQLHRVGIGSCGWMPGTHEPVGWHWA